MAGVMLMLVFTVALVEPSRASEDPRPFDVPGNRWVIAYNELPRIDRAWAVSLANCVTHGHGTDDWIWRWVSGERYGAFGFRMKDWRAAGGTSFPHHHSWHYQAVKAVGWMHKAGRSQWPVCG